MRNYRARPNTSDSQLIEAVATSLSAAGALRRLGRVAAGGNYTTLRNRIRLLGLSTAHWTGRGHLRGNSHSWARKYPLEKILVSDSDYRGGSSKLRLRLVKSGFLANCCSLCKITDWRGEPISLHLDHKNGDNRDQRLDNLRLLCPNCHSQTATYCGRNKGVLRLKRRLSSQQTI